MVVTGVDRAGRAERELVRRCRSGLDVDGVREGVFRALRELMPFDAAFFATADPDTLLFASAFAEEPLAAHTHRFLANEFGSDDVNRFASLATARRHVASLDAATAGDRSASGRYRDIMRPLELGDELRAAFVVDSACWGYLCLHRDDRPIGFTPSEAALLARLGPHIAHALRQAVLLHSAPPAGSGRPGVVVLADDLTTVATTPDAEHLLSEVETHGSDLLPLPSAVYAVAAALTAAEGGRAPPEAMPSSRVRTASGRWLNLHASRLRAPGDRGRIAVVVEPAEPQAMVPVLLSAHGLSPRESAVARLVLRGVSTREISDTLHISRHTVQDHLKAIFDKVGVRSRRDLVGLLLGGGASHG